MAITASVGYDGTGSQIEEISWAKYARVLGAEYGVMGAGDWKVTAVAGLDRTVQIAAGIGYGHGVFDTATPTNIQLPIVVSGVKTYIIYARRDWSGVGGLTIFTYAESAVDGSIPTRNNNPGVIDDQPIAAVLVSAGSTNISSIIDLRVWQANGGAAANSIMALQYLTAPGTSIFIGIDRWDRTVSATGSATWVKSSPPVGIDLFGYGNSLDGGGYNGQGFKMQAGSVVQFTDQAGYSRITYPVAFPNGLLYGNVSNGDSSVNTALGNTTLEFNMAGAPWHTGKKNEIIYRILGSGGLGASSIYHRANWLAIGW